MGFYLMTINSSLSASCGIQSIVIFLLDLLDFFIVFIVLFVVIVFIVLWWSGLTLGQTFLVLSATTFVQLMVLCLVKYLTSEKFRSKTEKSFNKMIHLLECLNLSFPYQDRDIENSTVLEFRRKHKEVAIEMLLNLLTNSVFSFCQLVPLWYTGI